MTNQIKGLFRFIIAFGIAAILLYISLGNIDTQGDESTLEFIKGVWDSSNKTFLLISALLAILSHLIRAARWKLLAEPLGYSLSLKNSFLSVMIGYFINLAIPRGGEISRCYNIYKLNGFPIDQSFGTVVAERIIDMLFLLSLIIIAFLSEFDKLWSFFMQLDYSDNEESSKLFIFSIILGGLLVLFTFGVFILIKFRRLYFLRLISKLKGLYSGLKKGLKSVFKVKNKFLFYFYSFAIWLIYFLMTYTIILSFPETENLGLLASLSIFTIGGIAMSVPLPGGTGSYHVLVPLGLVALYSIGQDQAVAFSFILHGWQTITIIILGSISLLWSHILIRRKIQHGRLSK